MSDIYAKRPRVRRPKQFRGESKTKQSFKDECDINVIVRRYREQGQIPPFNLQRPVYADFSNVDDYLTALNRVRSAQAAFAALPSKVRDHVKNDPAELIRLVMDPSRREELVELGLVERGKEPPVPNNSPPPSEPSPPAPAEEPA